MIKDRFDPRHNHLGTIRLLLALVVALTHADQIGFGHQPWIGNTRLGDLPVDAFFVLSGFLLAGSYLRLDSIPRYAWHRFLRIMPGFWACLLVTALLVAPAVARLQGLPSTSVFTGDESAWRYLYSNALLLMRQFGIDGLPGGGASEPGVLNGSLWTLFYEAVCYAAVVGLGVVGGLRHRRWITLAVVGLLWVLSALNEAGVAVVGQERMLRFALLFLIGTAIWLYAERVPVNGLVALAAAATVLIGLFTLDDYRVLAAPGLAYLCIWFVVLRPPATMPRSDFSYGLYVYHWPVLQILAVSGLADFGWALFVALGLALSMMAALVSWDLVEQPALRYKDAVWSRSGKAVKLNAVEVNAVKVNAVKVSSRRAADGGPRHRT